jgi:hypothetical protein
VHHAPMRCAGNGGVVTDYFLWSRPSLRAVPGRADERVYKPPSLETTEKNGR